MLRLSESEAIGTNERYSVSGLLLLILRRVFSFPTMIGALLVVLAILTVRARFNDPDMWWHLKVGEIIWNTHKIPVTDEFSFTTNNHSWIPHEWLSEVAIYAAYRAGGYTGLMVWLCVVSSLLLVAAYTLCTFYSGNVKVALLGALATWLFSTVGMAIRPHMLGYLLLVCELLLLHLGKSRNPRWFLLLPPLFAIWVNLHGSFFLGMIVLGTVLGCSFLNFRAGLLLCTPWNRQSRKLLGIAFVLSIPALFLNPVGWGQVTYPLNVTTNQATSLAAVAEWHAPSFTEGRDFALVAVAASLLLIPLLRRSDLRLQELLLVGLGFSMAIRHTRMMFVFGILAAPVLTRLLADTWDRYEPARDRIVPNLVMLVLAVCTIGVAFPARSDLEEQVQRGNPVGAVQFLREKGVSGRMLNEYGYGGYLIWAAPEHKVFIDGRGDIFDWTGVLREYGAWMMIEEDPKILLKKYNIDFCLLSNGAAMSRVLPLTPEWKMIYSDKVSTIFAKVR